LKAQKITVPGDISSAAYFIAAGLLVPGAEVYIHNVGINKTRDGILRVAQAMGGDITFLNVKEDGEPTADLLVRHSTLHGITIEGDIIPTLIDELPIINIMAACADGTTIIKDAAELKVKESDRISVMVKYLSAMGCDITGTDDGMIIQGGRPLHGAVIDSNMDHRIAMSFAIASLVADGETEIKGSDTVTISYPDFYKDLEKLTAG
jgi:3-phosphoshikimate 1-carboxyvinyltransferase